MKDQASDHEQIRIHLQVLDEAQTFTVEAAMGPRRLQDLLPPARVISEQSTGAAVRRVQSQGKEISCRAGCGACCRQLVAISGVEARSLAELVDTFPAEKQAVIRSRFAEALNRLEEAGLLDAAEPPGQRHLLGRDMGDPEATYMDLAHRYFLQKIPCPFLENESCGIYADRPLVCREYLVTSPAERCSRLFQEPVERLPISLRMSQVLMHTAHHVAGTDVEMVPLVMSLEWSKAHGAELDKVEDGMQLFQTMMAEIDKDFQKGFEERTSTEAK